MLFSYIVHQLNPNFCDSYKLNLGLIVKPWGQRN